MNKLVLLRHGESQWNLENRFTGWKDVPLTEKGVKEAKLAGELMNKGGITLRLVEFSQAMMGHLRGGLAHVNILSSMLFAGLSGSAVADTSAIGSCLLYTSPSPRDRG